ncbi:MAG TPA: ABC transporter permease [Propionibacteriaceae bacterium]|nr:ABC transporter permease [Propionibacteriaceae bacterium]
MTDPFWAIVARREIVVRVLNKSFLVSTLVTVLAIIGGMVFMAHESRSDTRTIAVFSTDAVSVVAAVDALSRESDGDGYESVTVADRTAAEALVGAGDADAYLDRGDDEWILVVKEFSPRTLTEEAMFREVAGSQTIASNAAAQGVDLAPLREGAALTARALDGGSSESRVMVTVTGLVFAVLFLLSAMGYGMQIAQSVVEEKQSRIVEILTAAIPVRQLLAGKVIGNSIIALGQLLLFLAISLVGMTFTPYGDALPTLGQGIGWFVVFFVAGFASLACIWAAAGALATRQEDLSETTMPLMMVMLGAYFAGFLATGAWRVGLSYVPILSSILMPLRVAVGEAQWWEAVLALALTLAFCVVAVLVGERMYRRGLLQTGARMSYRDALRSGESVS